MSAPFSLTRSVMLSLSGSDPVSGEKFSPGMFIDWPSTSRLTSDVNLVNVAQLFVTRRKIQFPLEIGARVDGLQIKTFAGRHAFIRDFLYRACDRATDDDVDGLAPQVAQLDSGLHRDEVVFVIVAVLSKRRAHTLL